MKSLSTFWYTILTESMKFIMKHAPKANSNYIILIKIKMNKSQKSNFTAFSKTKTNFRMLLKSRNNPKQTWEIKKINDIKQPMTITPKNQLQSNNPIDKIQLKQLKNFIQKKFKTQQNQSTQLNDTQINSVLQQSQVMRSSKQSFHSKLSEPHHRLTKSDNQQLYSIYNDIDGLNQKIDELTDIKLKHLDKSKKKNYHNDDLDNQLQTIMEMLNNISSYQSQNIEEDITKLQNKIKIVEKVIAQNVTEGQIMKKYFMKCVNRNKSRDNTLRPSSTNRSYNNIPILNKTHYQSKKIIKTESVNHTTFRKPKNNDYKIYKHKERYFNADRHLQPLIRSCYNRQYLNFGASPTQSIKPKDSDCIKYPSPNKRVKTSYDEDYPAKNMTDIINYKQLDAYKDKLKDLQVDYGKKRKSQDKEKLTSLSSYKKNDKKKQVFQSQKFAQGSFLTESKRQFAGGNNRSLTIKKNDFLQKMKYALKKKLKI